MLEVEYATVEDRKLRGSLRDVSGIEAQITAIQVRWGRAVVVGGFLLEDP